MQRKLQRILVVGGNGFIGTLPAFVLLHSEHIGVPCKVLRSARLPLREEWK